MNIAVAGTGYVGMSIATLLAQHNHVIAVDVIPEKVEKINNKISPIQDDYIEKYLSEKKLDLTATLDAKKAYSDAEFVIIAAPTNYDPQLNFFDTSAVEDAIEWDLMISSNLVSENLDIGSISMVKIERILPSRLSSIGGEI